MLRHKKLEIYNLSITLVKEVYGLINKLPETERFALASQARRAAISIPSNIAEGVSRYSGKEKIHFINIAYGSLMELTCQMEISTDLEFIQKSDFDKYEKSAEKLAAPKK